MKYSPFLSCRRAAWLLTARLDRELDPFERVALAFHLRICAACPEMARQLGVLRESVRSLRDGLER